MRVRLLSEEGVASFRSYLGRVREGSTEVPPTELLEADGASLPLPQPFTGRDIVVERFSSKMEMVQYLSKYLEGIPRDFWRHELGLWAWLALWMFDQLAPAASNGTRKLLTDELYIPTAHFQRRYRNLLLGPFLVYALHQQRARLLLAKPVNVWSDVEEQLLGVQGVIQIPGALEAADLLYFDTTKQEGKRGITNRNKGGTIRRLREVLQQLDLTFDVNALSGEEIVGLLPAEFDRFRPEPNA
jgi:hypothetical protein